MPDSPAIQECVEGYVYRRDPLRLLVLRRPPHRGNIWVPVSGKVEASDRDFEYALRRELAEETGFTEFRGFFSLDWEVTFDGPDHRPWRLHAFGVELDRERTPRLSEEHEAFEWVSPEEALHRLHYPDNREAVAKLLQHPAVAAGRATQGQSFSGPTRSRPPS